MTSRLLTPFADCDTRSALLAAVEELMHMAVTLVCGRQNSYVLLTTLLKVRDLRGGEVDDSKESMKSKRCRAAFQNSCSW